jgi:hypothetical protein
MVPLLVESVLISRVGCDAPRNAGDVVVAAACTAAAAPLFPFGDVTSSDASARFAAHARFVAVVCLSNRFFCFFTARENTDVSSANRSTSKTSASSDPADACGDGVDGPLRRRSRESLPPMSTPRSRARDTTTRGNPQLTFVSEKHVSRDWLARSPLKIAGRRLKSTFRSSVTQA